MLPAPVLSERLERARWWFRYAAFGALLQAAIPLAFALVGAPMRGLRFGLFLLVGVMSVVVQRGIGQRRAWSLRAGQIWWLTVVTLLAWRVAGMWRELAAEGRPPGAGSLTYLAVVLVVGAGVASLPVRWLAAEQWALRRP